MESKKYPPYLFDLDFDALALPPEPEEVEETPPPPTFSEAELQAARDTAFEAGKAEGVAQANTGFEYQITEALSTLQRGFAEIAAAQYAANHETMHDSVKVAAAIVGKLLPAYAQQNGLVEIETFVKATISTLFAEADLVVRVPEPLAEELSKRLAPAATAAGLAENLKVVADPTLGPTDCRLDWGNGGAERNGEQLLAEIDAIVERFIEHNEIPAMTIDLEQPPEPTPEIVDSPAMAAPSIEQPAVPPLENAATAPIPNEIPTDGAILAPESQEPLTAPLSPAPEAETITPPTPPTPQAVEEVSLEQPPKEELPPQVPEPSELPAIALPPIEQVEQPVPAETPEEAPAPAALPGAIDTSVTEPSN